MIWLTQPRRFRLFTLLSLVLIFFLPMLGWGPMLALWLIHLIFCFRETTDRFLRVFYSIMFVVVLGALLHSIVGFIYAI